MADEKKCSTDRDTMQEAAALPLGAGIGTALGAGAGTAMGDIATGAGIGTALGIAIGALLMLARQRNKSDEMENEK